ncbi:MAG: DHH family phosphoesterase [Erysipelotrichaceae bacterium]
MAKIIELSVIEANRYQDKYGVSPLIAQVLAADEVSDEHVRELLNSEAYARCEDERFRQAAHIIEAAIKQQTKILVCGDYDADGLCATSIMVRTLRKLNADVGFYIPDRFNEGYGLIKETVDKALEKGYRLFITVDNGVSAYEALNAIHEGEGQSLVLDHHEITDEVPCDLLIHPSLLSEEYRYLCGAGLALQLAEHLIGQDDYNTALAGIATVGDMVELWSANRKIVLDALRLLNRQRFASIEALSEKPVDLYDEETLAFQIVPKLNVAGRLADEANANRIVDYLCSDSQSEIARQSQQIIELNKKRKNLSNSMYDTARALRTGGNVVVLTHHSFHEGIVGITAGRLAKEIGRPVFVFAQKGDTLKGSARSVADVDLRALTQDVQGLCIRYGGHAMAAGLEIKGEDLAAFMAGLNQKADAIDWSDTQETLAVLSPDAASLQASDFNELLRLSPFGSGFPMPLMRFKNCAILSYRAFSSTFRKWRLKWGNVEFDAVYFGELDDPAQEFTQGRFDLIGKVKTERFRNVEKLSILIEVLQASL